MVEIRLESKRYNCTVNIKEKVTFIKGDSGVGKTEFSRRLSSVSRANKITVSNGFDVVVLHPDVFKSLCKRAINSGKGTESKIDNIMKSYWGIEDNFPYYDSIIVIDDEDFVKTREFSIFYNCDKYNYYIIINRGKVPGISYSADEIYNFMKNGKEHYLEKAYKYPVETGFSKNIDYVLTEGKGSDFIFFNEMLKGKVLNPSLVQGNMNTAGKSNLIKCLNENAIFKNSTIFILIDFCAFGSDIEDLYSVCRERGIKAYFDIGYLSFEYLLLVSNLIKDDDLKSYVEENRLRFLSLEALFTDRLHNLTLEKPYKYSKSSKDFPVCYYKDCCTNRKIRNVCGKRLEFMGKDKLAEMLKGTKFERLLELREVLNV